MHDVHRGGTGHCGDFGEGLNSTGTLEIAGAYEGDGTRRMSGRVTPGQMADLFAGVTRAGGASPAPTGEKAAATEISNFRFEISD